MNACHTCGGQFKWLWWYMPSDADRKYCNECVPRGCSCQWFGGVEDLDFDKRSLPCVEYDWVGPEQSKWDEVLLCRIDHSLIQPLAQYCSWDYLATLRKLWTEQGHFNVPSPKCPCNYLGYDKIPACSLEGPHQC